MSRLSTTVFPVVTAHDAQVTLVPHSRGAGLLESPLTVEPVRICAVGTDALPLASLNDIFAAAPQSHTLEVEIGGIGTTSR